MNRSKFVFAVIAFGIVEAFHLRNYFSGRISADYTCCIEKWYDFIKLNGFYQSFKFTFSDYAPFYLHMVAVSTLLPLKKIIAIKAISVCFDIILAVFVYKILRFLNEDKLQAWKSVAVVLLCPTVILNGAYWGQSDVIYGSMVIAAIYFLIKNKLTVSFIWLGLAFSVKLQSIFIFPLFLLATLRNKSDLKYWALIPAVYFLTILPSWIAGRPLMELLGIYASQAKDNELTLFAPTFYPLIPDAEKYHDLFAVFGMIFTALSSVFIIIYALRWLKSSEFTPEIILTLALLFSLLVPYFLPHMHERYFFLADVLSIVYVFVFRKNYFLPFIIIGCSTFCYLKYLVNFIPVRLPHLSFLMLIALAVVFYELVNLLENESLQKRVRHSGHNES